MTFLLDDRIRGVPPGVSLPATEVAAQGWHPAGGAMSLPVLTFDEGALAANRDAMLRYCRERGLALAPHGKTPMVPDLARAVIAAGGWGTTVADIRQAAVMLRAGLTRLILANEVGGPGGAARLAALCAAYPQAELYVFADGAAAAEALGTAWRARPELPPLRVLVETGAGRAGARTAAAARAVRDAVLGADGRLTLAGVATYEAAAAHGTPQESLAAVDAVLDLAADAFRAVREAAAGPLVVTAGGSVWFDRVAERLGPVVAADGDATLVLRSGAFLFADHGLYAEAFDAMTARGGFPVVFRPALRVWAEVLSRPEPGLALCGMGMRDVSFDRGYPTPLRVWRGGRPLGPLDGRVERLNDQHAFVAVGSDSGLAVGDVVEFGISHPCTCLDRYRVLFGLGPDGTVSAAYATEFG